MKINTVEIIRTPACLAAVVLVSILFRPSPAAAQAYWNVSGTGDWNIDANWSGNITPDISGTAIINNSGTAVILSGSSGQSDTVYVGYSSGSNGGLLISGSLSGKAGYIGYNSGANGTVVVNGAGYWAATGNAFGSLYVGYSGTGNLTITDSGSLQAIGNSFIGSNNTGVGTVTVNGSGYWNSGNSSSVIYVGNSGSGSLVIADSGSVNSAGNIFVAYAGISVGSITVTDSGYLNNNSAYLNIGYSGTATLTIAGSGSVRDSTAYLAASNNSVGSATISGSGFWNNTNTLSIGNYGTGTLVINESGSVNSATGYIGTNAVGVGSAAVSGSAFWSNSGNLYVGYSGTGSLTVTESGSIRVGGTTFIGYGASGTGALNLQGGLLATRGISKGQGNATLNLNGSTIVALVNNNNFFNNLGDLVLNGSGVDAGQSTLKFDTNGYTVTATNNFSFTGSNRAFEKTGAGTLTLSGSSDLGASGNLYANGGTLAITKYLRSWYGYIGELAGQSAAVTVSGTWRNTDNLVGGNLYIGDSGTGNLTITGNGLVTNSEGFIGNNNTGVGSVTVSGNGYWNNDGGGFNVGYSGTGSLTITDSGSVNGNYGYIGHDTNSNGSVTVSGSGYWNNNGGSLYVGYSGTGNLTITDSGSVSDQRGYIGHEDTGVGTVTVSGSGYWNNRDGLYVGGYFGSGSLLITDSGSVSSNYSYIGVYNKGAATVSGSGYWQSANTLYVGYVSSGSLSIRDWGRVNADEIYSQSSLGTLDVTLTDGRTSAYITSGTAILDGTLNLSGVSGTVPQTASEIGNDRVLILATTDGIGGDFANIIIGGGTSTADYATITAAKSADGKNYEAGLYLTWYTGTATAHGNFTVEGTFTVDLPLVDQNAVNQSGWDGKSLTKLGDGTLVLSASNSYSGGTLIDSGTLVAQDANALGSGTVGLHSVLDLDFTGTLNSGNLLSGTGSLNVLQDVTLGHANDDFTGHTTVLENSNLSLGVSNAIQHSSVTVNNGGVLNLGGFNQTVANLTNNGLVDFNQLGKKLTVTGNLGGNGDFRIDTDIAAGTADTIEVQGSSSGDHRLLITNLGNTPTGKEQALLLVNTADGIATFSGSVGVGMFDYTVLNGAALNLDASDWYLSLVSSQPSSTGDAVLNTAAAISGFWFTQMDNLNKRMGELRYNDTLRQAQGERGLVENVWVRSYGQQVNLNTGISGVKGFSETQYGVDLGTDKAWLLDNNNTLYTGVFAGYGGADRDFHSGYNGSTDSGYGGLYGTWINKDGWYADAVAKGQYFDTSFDGEDHGSYNSYGVGLSLELGRQFQFADGWFAEPSVQVSYLHLMNDNYATTQGTEVDLSDADVIQFYGGARLGRNIKLNDKGWLQPYVKVGGIQQISSGGQVRAEGDEWRPTTDGARGVIGAGIVYQFTDADQLHLDYEASFGDKYDKPWGLNFGYRHQF